MFKHEIKGAEKLLKLRGENVLFVSNHQTYFADVSFFLIVIHSAFNNRLNKLSSWGPFNPKKHNIYYIAAEETMKSGLLPKLMALSGAVTVQRSWRANGENVRRKVSKTDAKNIDMAIQDGWVITFPQGTTSPYAQGRIGTSIMIKNHEPIVVPIVIDGFRRSFDKKGLKTKKRRSTLKMTIKDPLDIDYSKTAEEILSQVMEAIEQSPGHNFMERVNKKEATE
ncbi:MAG: 1-acyl-sn-glycerol-3-phosphate acyltransferase [Arenicella sp.]|jgi:1-acyl-sn-glycerol-3-phosphate acyltransferase